MPSPELTSIKAPLDEAEAPPQAPTIPATAIPATASHAPTPKRHSALTAPIMALTAGALSGITLWIMGERDAYAPPLLSFGLWVVWRSPSGRIGRGVMWSLSALYALGGGALLWERSAAHPVWQVNTDTWALTPESLTLKLCACLFVLSWIVSWRLSPLRSPLPPLRSPAQGDAPAPSPHEEV